MLYVCCVLLCFLKKSRSGASRSGFVFSQIYLVFIKRYMKGKSLLKIGGWKSDTMLNYTVVYDSCTLKEVVELVRGHES